MKFTKTLAGIAAAAVAVSCAVIPASALGTSGQLTAVEGDYGPDATCIQINSTTVDEASVWAFQATDVITVTAAAANGEDTSTWNLALNCFDSSWGGWQGVQTEAGVLEGTFTIQECMDAIGCTDVSTFGGFIFQVWNCQVGDVIDWTIDISPAAAEEEPAPEVGESEEVPEGTPIELANPGVTVIDAGLVRTNIINPWGDETTVIAESDAFAGAKTFEVKFTVSNFTEAFDAWVSFADKSWANQFWGAGNEGNTEGADSTVVNVTGDGEYTITVTVPAYIDAMEFIAVCTNLEAAEGDALPTIAVDSIMVTATNEKPADEEPTEPVPGESSGETNVPTGVALAVVPAALAAAALATSGIVLKKRSK